MITGHFISVDVPQVPIGEDILATIDFYAINPGAWWYWATFLIVDIPAMGVRKLLDKARETGEEGGRQKTYNLGPMPDQSISISFFLFAHEDANHDWNWSEYYAWLEGWPIEVTYLDSDYVFLTPGELPPTDLKVLRYEILGEEAGGSIIFNPPPLDYEGHYVKGTVVSLTAVVNPGFVFVRWHGDVNESITSLTNSITMDENHTVRAEFALVEVERLHPLEVDITPVGGGYVKTSPPPTNIENHFTDGTIGTFSEGIRVQVTAYPNTGFVFDHWSDEIQGGVSYNPIEWVSGVMDEHKAVKAHFREVEIPPECAIDADCPIGYVCQNGVCVPEEPPPDDEEPPEKKEFPWLPVALIGGGAVVAIVATKPKKSKA